MAKKGRPSPAATGKGLGNDRPGSAITPQDTAHRSELQPAQLIDRIRAHIASGDKARDKSDQHYISAGRYLQQLKAQHTGSSAEWEQLLKDRIGIGKSRAYELIAIAD